jgi:methionine synthase I (cobalamin-dependent)
MWWGTHRAGHRSGGEAGAERGPALLDGAMGTELIARGLDLSCAAPETWVLERPEIVREVHAAYVAAGADILQTCSFGATRPRLERVGLGEEVAAVNRQAVSLARAEAAGRPVLASLGPTGIDPFSSGAAATMAAAYRQQIAALAEAGVDGLHFETLYHPLEATQAVAAARQVAPRLPIILSATYALGDHGFQTPLGVPLPVMTQALLAAAPDALGINCSLEARKMLGLVRQLRELVGPLQARPLALVVQPQGGPAEIDCRAPRRGADVEEFVRGLRAILGMDDIGVAMVGGCCGAGPAHIAALAAALHPERATS